VVGFFAFVISADAPSALMAAIAWSFATRKRVAPSSDFFLKFLILSTPGQMSTLIMSTLIMSTLIISTLILPGSGKNLDCVSQD
jgi:hypothetical protein